MYSFAWKSCSCELFRRLTWGINRKREIGAGFLPQNCHPFFFKKKKLEFIYNFLVLVIVILLIFNSRMDLKNQIILIILVFIMTILQYSLTHGKPYDMWSNYQSLIPKSETDCDITEEIETLCQKCAKQTKSSVVYPMCCQNREEAREWCHKYISFGLQ